MLDQLREEVCAVAKRAQADGLCKHKSGNFSALDADSGLVAITPSGVDRDLLAPKHIVVMRLSDGTVLECPEGLRPTSEYLMHLAIYRTRPDARAIVHTHSLYATSFAIVGRPVPAVIYEMFTLGTSQARFPVAPYARPGSPELADSVVDACRESDCFLLERHGAVALDETDVAGAYLKACYVEEISHLYFNALQIGGGAEPAAFSAEELAAWHHPDDKA